MGGDPHTTAFAESLTARYAPVLEACEPYLVASPFGAATIDGPAPPGLDMDRPHYIDPHRVESREFLTLLQRLDTLTRGPSGMALPRWAFYDCAEVPGGIFGFALRADRMPPWAREVMAIGPDYEGLVPVSMLIAIPMLEPGSWHCYVLTSINEVAPGAAPFGLLPLTVAAALSVIGMRAVYGVTQWRAVGLPVYALFAPLELITAWTPGHTKPRTLTFRFTVSPRSLAAALTREYHTDDDDDLRWMNCDDTDEMQALQRRIEAGRRFEIAGPPRTHGSQIAAPIREVTS